MNHPFHDPTIEERFNRFENSIFALKMRDYLFSLAENLELNSIEESLKWNQPSYLSKNGTAVRIAEQAGRMGYFVSCQTSIIETLKESYPDADYDKTRGLLIDADSPIPEVASSLIHAALQYKIKTTV